MKTPLLICLAAAALLTAPFSSQAGNIVWVAQVDSPNGQEFIDLLELNGHSVTKLIASSNTLIIPDDLDLMDAADLVIFSRQTNSGQYNSQDWDTVSAPMLVMTPYVLRAVRWGADIPWFTGDAIPDETPDIVIVDQPTHPIFDGVELNEFDETGPWHVAVDRGTTLLNADIDSGGTILATSTSFAVIAAEWPANTVAVGPRLYLSMGSREAAGGTTADSGKYNITPLGEQIFLNAVAIYSEPSVVIDSDGDGVPNDLDAFPNDINEWEDTDGDGIGNNADPDDDGDDVEDGEDAFPLDKNESVDSDSDGIGDNADLDDDNDGIDDLTDKFPFDASEWDDDDNDGIGNNADPDADGDGTDDPPTSNIVWVRQVDTTAGDEFITLLNNNGHNVTPWVGDSATLSAFPEDFARVFNEADLVIFSRTVVSGNYQTDIWDRITAPMIVMSPFVTRSTHWGWFDGTALSPADVTPLSIFVDQPAHPLFEGVTITNGETAAWHTAIDRGTTFSNDTVVNGGTLIASTVELYPAAAEWPTGAVASGPRMLLPMGSWEIAGAGPENSGLFNLTPTGETILLNAVKYYTPPLTVTPGGGAPFRISSTSYDAPIGEFTATFPSEAGKTYRLQRSPDLKTWTPVTTTTATAESSDLTDSAAPATPTYYRVVELP